MQSSAMHRAITDRSACVVTQRSVTAVYVCGSDVNYLSVMGEGVFSLSFTRTGPVRRLCACQAASGSSSYTKQPHNQNDASRENA